jgi:hypothetical protein
MRSNHEIVVSIALMCLSFTAPAHAQQRLLKWRGRVSINGGLQPSTGSVQETVKSTIYLEPFVVTPTYRIKTAPQFDGGFAMRVAGNLGVGVAMSFFSKKNAADISAQIPHPFFYSTRLVSGAANDLQRNEVNTHIQAVYVVPSRGKTSIALMGGPSFFHVKQDLVTSISYNETYPYDTASFGNASTIPVAKNGVGFNAGVDIALRVSRNMGVGGIVRFSRAGLELAVPNGVGNQSVNVGGVHVGGGVRFFF